MVWTKSIAKPGGISLCILFYASIVYAQPYVDIVQLRALKSIGNSTTQITNFYAGSDLPIQLKNGALLVLSPFYENWKVDTLNVKSGFVSMQSVALPLSAIIPLGTKYKLSITALPRWNGKVLFSGNSFQLGGAVAVAYEVENNLKLRIGMYVNKEFFGLFLVPLAGIDWKIDSSNSIFGLLPGRLTYEHRLNDKIYFGATFRSITNSYRLSPHTYMRIDDNQVSAFLDYYFTKHFVLTVEPGGGLFRKLRLGVDEKQGYTKVFDFTNGLFIKASIAYRVRL